MMAAPDLRRGWCPGMLRPMQTGDGLLVRLHPRSGRFSSVQAKAIAYASRHYGNGLLDISARGNLQIRGVCEATHGALVECLVSAGITDGTRSNGPYRLTLTSPLAGDDPTDILDAQSLADQIEDACQGIEGLPAKMLIVVDGGGVMSLDEVDSDLRLVAVDRDRLALGLQSEQGLTWAGVVPVNRAAELIKEILSRYKTELTETATGSVRMRGLSPAAQHNLFARLNLGMPIIPASRAKPCPVGIAQLSRSATLLVTSPFGRCGADDIEQMALWAETLGNGALHLSPWRGMALPGLTLQSASALAEKSTRLGFITTPGDPRLNIWACPGAPSCSKGSTLTHADGLRIAEAARPFLQDGGTIHVSGCLKGCAHPDPADLTLIGDAGTYGVVAGGTARQQPCERLDMDTILLRLDSIRSKQDIITPFSKTKA